MKEPGLEVSVADHQKLHALYEHLRRQRLEGIAGRGMAVLLDEGMCGWIRAWTQWAPGTDIEIGCRNPSPSIRDPSDMGVQDNAGKAMGGLVELIASMALTKIQGV